jgi:hypothetical protein
MLPANTEAWTLSGLTAGQSYEFHVRACDTFGCSDWSNTVTAAAGMLKLSVSITGAGKVTSSPAGINCGSQTPNICFHYYAPGTVVSLTGTGYTNAHLGIQWVLDHWAGACTGWTPCSVTMTGPRSVEAVFEDIS